MCSRQTQTDVNTRHRGHRHTETQTADYIPQTEKCIKRSQTVDTPQTDDAHNDTHARAHR